MKAAGRCKRSAKRCLADPPAALAGPVCRAHARVRKRIASGCAALSLRQAKRKQERREKAAELLQHKLTVNAEWLQEQIERISHALMSDTEAVLLPEGDYSDHQRSRLVQQAISSSTTSCWSAPRVEQTHENYLLTVSTLSLSALATIWEGTRWTSAP